MHAGGAAAYSMYTDLLCGSQQTILMSTSVAVSGAGDLERLHHPAVA